jgi:hypothetical protein
MIRLLRVIAASSYAEREEEACKIAHHYFRWSLAGWPVRRAKDFKLVPQEMPQSKM